MPPNVKETELRRSDKVNSPSAGKSICVALVLWKRVPKATSGGVDIPEVPGCHLLRPTSSQRMSQKLIQGRVSHQLTTYFSDFHLILMLSETAILLKVRKQKATSSKFQVRCKQKIAMLSLYPQGDKSRLRKPKKDKHQR